MGSVKGWVIGCDPGKDHAAFAVFYEAKLRELRFSERIGCFLPELEGWEIPEILVIEKMQLQGRASMKDILDVSFTAGEVAGTLQPDLLIRPTPAEWKGSTPKHIHHLRIAEAVPGARELVAKLPKGQQGHVWDAIGLGWWYVSGRKKL